LQDKEALQQQQYNNLIQISALQSKLDEARHRVPADGGSAPVLKEQLQAEQEALQTREREVRALAGSSRLTGHSCDCRNTLGKLLYWEFKPFKNSVTNGVANMPSYPVLSLLWC